MKNVSPAVVETNQLAVRLGDPVVRIVDASWFLPTMNQNARAEYEQRHIPGAIFFDIDRIADPDTDLPHMLPSAGDFAKAVGAMGIDNNSFVVVYDSVGLFSAPRVWWTFRVFGHERVSVLNGGLPKWLAEGHPVESGAIAPSPRLFKAIFRPEMVRSLGEVRQRSQDGLEQILDARPMGRFNGTTPEPRPDLPSGHMPKALNLPYDQLFDPVRKTILPPKCIKARLTAAGVAKDQPVICTCGSGITACVLAFALHLTGREDAAVYDGSWTEWAGQGSAIIKQ